MGLQLNVPAKNTASSGSSGSAGINSTSTLNGTFLENIISLPSSNIAVTASDTTFVYGITNHSTGNNLAYYNDSSTTYNFYMFTDTDQTKSGRLSDNSSNPGTIGGTISYDHTQSTVNAAHGMDVTFRLISATALKSGLSVGLDANLQLPTYEAIAMSNSIGGTTTLDFNLDYTVTLKIMRLDGTLVTIGSDTLSKSGTSININNNQTYNIQSQGITTNVNPKYNSFHIDGTAATSQEGDRLVLDVNFVFTISNSTGANNLSTVKIDMGGSIAHQTNGGTDSGTIARQALLTTSVS